MKILALNKRIKFDYEITDTLIAGVVLEGAEVKSIKNGHISLKGAYISLRQGEAFLIGTHVSPYRYAAAGFEETRDRKLLLHANELQKLLAAKQNGLSIMPTAVGIQRGLVKVEVGIGRGRKKYDKRALLKKRQADRDIARLREHA